MQHSWTFFPTQSFDLKPIQLTFNALTFWIFVHCDLFHFRFLVINFNCLIKFHGILMSYWCDEHLMMPQNLSDFGYEIRLRHIRWILPLIMRYLQIIYSIKFHSNLSIMASNLSFIAVITKQFILLSKNKKLGQWW